MMSPRSTRDEMYMNVCFAVAQRAACLRRSVGAVLTRDGRIIAAGYNGPPSGYDHCVVCLKFDAPSGQGLESCPAIHAEANAIMQAAKMGFSTQGATLYCTTQPCWECLKMCVSAGITTIHYKEPYEPTNPDLYYDLVETCDLALIQQ